MIKFIPIYQYSKEKGVSRQTIYRWIREGKVPEGRVRTVEKIVQRKEIDADFKLK